MRRRDPDRVTARGIDARYPVGRAVITREEGAAVKRFGDVRRELAKGLAADVRQIPVPAGILDTQVPGTIARRDPQPGELREDAITHECADAHRAVVRAGHRVADTGVDSPYTEPFGQPDAALELRRLTEQRQQGASLAANRGHLVHDA